MSSNKLTDFSALAGLSMPTTSSACGDAAEGNNLPHGGFHKMGGVPQELNNMLYFMEKSI